MLDIKVSLTSGIANHYLLPYNRKIWDTEPSEMTCEWMRYLPTADVKQIIRNAYQPNNERFGYNIEFFYPIKKGIQNLTDVFAKRLSNIHLNEEVVNIDTNSRIVYFASGHQVYYKTLISTLPLLDLIRMTSLTNLKKAAETLIYTSVYMVNIVIKGQVPEGVHWMYFPDPDLEFYRMSFPKSYFDKSTPDDEQILAVEVGSRNHKLNFDEIKEKVINQVSKMDVFKIDKIVFTYCIKIPVAYCIYDKNRTRTVKGIRAELDMMGIKSIGRYGQWEYSTMEDAILYGRNLALKMKGLK